MSTLQPDLTAIEARPPSMAHQFLARVAQSPTRPAFGYPSGGAFKYDTWAETGERVRDLAAGLLALGLEREERVGIVATTRVEWIHCDLAILCAGGATTTVYPSTHAADTAYILDNSGCGLVFAENAEQIAKLVENRDKLAGVRKVIAFDAPAESDWIITLDDLATLGKERRAQSPDEVDAVIATIKSDELATLIYTSGTTGRPKGVRLQHGSWTYEGAATRALSGLTEEDLQFLWLPMAHSFGKVLLSAQLSCGFATAVDGTVEKIIDNLAVVKPTFMGAAPRIFEKAYARIVTMTEAEGGVKEKLFKRAFAVGLKVDQLKLAGQSVPAPLRAQHALFDKLVFSKVRARFGGRVRFFISGAAALNPEIATWFHAAGIKILEGYGLTETSAGAAVNQPEAYKLGTVGRAFPGSEIELGENNEIMIRGPHIMQGYHELPEETAKALTEDGWLHTGDTGSIDADGFITISGRIKELFKTSGGKYVAPPAIEAAFKALCPYVSQFMVFGSERQYCIALVTLDADAIAGWAKQNGVAGDYAAIASAPQTRAMIQGYIDQLNAGLNRWETIKKFKILDYDLSVESGEMTPSMKVKRNVVETNHAEAIDGLYSE